MDPTRSIDELRNWLARDQVALNTMSERLKELEAMNPEDIQASTRNSLSTWDRSTISKCSEHLDVMEQIKSPSKEERSIMSELHKLVCLGDLMIDRINAMRATFADKGLRSNRGRQEPPSANAVPNHPKESMEEIPSKPVRTEAPREGPKVPGNHSTVSDGPASPISPSPPIKEVEPSAPRGTELADNKLICDLLGVTSDAPLAAIKKAVRKQTMQRHPDRLQSDPEASTKFADFKILCGVLEKNESREEYNQTGQVEDVDDLAGLVARLRLT